MWWRKIKKHAHFNFPHAQETRALLPQVHAYTSGYMMINIYVMEGIIYKRKSPSIWNGMYEVILVDPPPKNYIRPHNKFQELIYRKKKRKVE